MPDGRVHYEIKKKWRDGTHALIFDPLSFIGRLIALIPPPRVHLLRFSWRARPPCESTQRSRAQESRCDAATACSTLTAASVTGRGSLVIRYARRQCSETPEPTSLGLSSEARVRGRRDGLREMRRAHAAGRVCHHACRRRTRAGACWTGGAAAALLATDPRARSPTSTRVWLTLRSHGQSPCSRWRRARLALSEFQPHRNRSFPP